MPLQQLLGERHVVLLHGIMRRKAPVSEERHDDDDSDDR